MQTLIEEVESDFTASATAVYSSVFYKLSVRLSVTLHKFCEFLQIS